MMSKSAQIMGALLLLSAAALAAPPAAAAPAPPPAAQKVNINTAGVEELLALPGIGPAYAARIVEYREKNGPFKKLEDLLNVRGIGEKTFERIRDRLTLGKS
ncbi:MAG TPA: helix-hairpin-helix domain-containing protein [Candidatus Polarisedimenticolia bacterium]|nr:helix-hairpin-helix domain-containing protein [Candidatus Polarisedimenticolia bacterium]